MQIKIVAFKWRVKGRAAAHTRAINWKIKAEQGGCVEQEKIQLAWKLLSRFRAQRKLSVCLKQTKWKVFTALDALDRPMQHATILPNSVVVLGNLHKSPSNLLHPATICGPAGRSTSCQLTLFRLPYPRSSVKNQAKRLPGWQQHQQLNNDEIVVVPVTTCNL